MIFNDYVILETLILLSIIFYTTNTNIMMLLYTAGLYLILIGIFCLISDADIYVGFLWVIDLGVGLIFFIFILHFTSFLSQKSPVNLSARHFTISYCLLIFFVFYYYYFSFSAPQNTYADFSKLWFFKVNSLDYYMVYFSQEVTELNTLKDSYFLANGFEFFIVNFSLLFGLLTSIFLCFMLHRIFNFLNFSQILNANSLTMVDTGFFIRNQSYSSQVNTTATAVAWSKNRGVL